MEHNLMANSVLGWAIAVAVLAICARYLARLLDDAVAATLAPLYLFLCGGFFYPFAIDAFGPWLVRLVNALS